MFSPTQDDEEEGEGEEKQAKGEKEKYKAEEDEEEDEEEDNFKESSVEQVWFIDIVQLGRDSSTWQR